MPVQRTKALKRDDSCNQIVWDSNVDAYSPPSTDLSFSLAPNYALSDTPPPLVDRPSPEFILFPPPTDLTPSTKRTPHSKKKPSNHIPRPPNAFILFRSSFIKSQHVTTEVETNHSTLSKIIGLTWQNLPEDERQIWHAKAKDALEDHKRKFPKYAFRPVQTKAKASSTNGGGGGVGSGGGLGSGGGTEKRRVREVEPKDIKRCAKIAELLVEGKKGASLKAAIAEFDKYHVPEIVTRFETPITAKAFRRSSSAPVPGVDAEEEQQQGGKAMFVSENPTGKKQVGSKGKKARASSTQPLVAPAPAPAPAPLVAPIAPVVYQPQPYALKQENSFNFDDFNFTSTLPSPALECDPFFLPSTTPSPLDYSACSPLALSIDTQSYHDWASSSSASSPTSPLPATPSDVHALSPAPSFAHFELGVAAFQGQELLSQEFLLDTAAIQQNMCAQGMYAYPQHQHQQHEQQLVGEFDFSSYMGMGMQYAM